MSDRAMQGSVVSAAHDTESGRGSRTAGDFSGLLTFGGERWREGAVNRVQRHTRLPKGYLFPIAKLIVLG
jgi:hypothetical protein